MEHMACYSGLSNEIVMLGWKKHGIVQFFLTRFKILKQIWIFSKIVKF